MHKGYLHSEDTKRKMSRSHSFIHKEYNLANHIEELMVEEECSNSNGIYYIDWVYDTYRPVVERNDY